MTTNLAVIVGQSNALGYQVSPSELPSWWVNTARVQIWADTNGNGVGDTWNYMNPGVNTGTLQNPTAWGPEVAFAYQWLQEHPGETLWIVKSVKGSTSLAEAPGLNNDWSLNSHELFDATTAAVAAAKAAISGPFDTSVLWFQGEQDATSQTYASSYGNNLVALQNAASAQWGANRFLYARIDTDYAYNSTVQSYQPLGFNTDEFQKQSDNLHLTGSGQIDSGFSFYTLYDTTPLTVPTGTSGNDNYVGSTGADSVSAMDGNDALYGGPGADWFHGNVGNDTIYGGAGNDTLYGGQGHDKISADDGDDYVQGNIGNDTLSGGWGADTMYGGQDNDVLLGSLGNDFLAGDSGNDTYGGGAGADRYYFTSQGGVDIVTDFNGSEGDRLQLASGTAYSLSEVSGNTVLTFAAGSATLQGVPLSSFSTSWII